MKTMYVGICTLAFTSIINAASLTADKEQESKKLANAVAIIDQLRARDVIGDGAGLPPDIARIVFDYAGTSDPGMRIKRLKFDQEPLGLGANARGEPCVLVNHHNALMSKNICTGKTRTIPHNLGMLSAAAFGRGKDGKLLVALYSREHNCLQIKNAQAHTLKSWQTPDHTFNKIIIRNYRDGTPLIATISDTKVCLWDMALATAYREFNGRDYKGIDFRSPSHDRMCIALGSQIWDVVAQRHVMTLKIEGICLCWPIAFAPQADAVAVGDGDNRSIAALATHSDIHVYHDEGKYSLSCDADITCLALDRTQEGAQIIAAGLCGHYAGANLAVWVTQPDGSLIGHSYKQGISVSSVMTSKDKKGTMYISSLGKELSRETDDGYAYSVHAYQWGNVPGEFETEYKKHLAGERSDSSRCVIM